MWPAQIGSTIQFMQEDSPDEIGWAIAIWNEDVG
jgi:hypothetical protein